MGFNTPFWFWAIGWMGGNSEKELVALQPTDERPGVLFFCSIYIFYLLIMSQITTHILDTSQGKPAAGVSIHLQKPTRDGWENLASGITNSDGRIPDLLPQEQVLAPGIYSMLFDVADYFARLEVKSFYPSIRIEFEVFDQSHYHIPLLLNPFGYSTYRGS